MGEFLKFIGDWGHVFAAALFAALAIWTGRRLDRSAEGRLSVAALSLTAIWSLSIAFTGVDRLETGMLESLRNCAWLTALFALPGVRGEGQAERSRGFAAVYAVLVAILLAQSITELLGSISEPGNATKLAATATALLLRMIWAIGALMFIARLFSSVAPPMRIRIAPIMAALSAMWAYDLLLYASAWFQRDSTSLLFASRGLIMACLTPVIALSVRPSGASAIRPSRKLTERGLGLFVALAMLLVVLTGVAFLDRISIPLLRVIATGVIFASIVAALVVLPSERFRAYVKVMVAKHVFAHRYDYRSHWMAFADTIGRSRATDVSIYERAIKAVADITESPAGLLLLTEGDRLIVHSQWNWPEEAPLGASVTGEWVRKLGSRNWVFDIDQHRAVHEPALPSWLAESRTAWALVPVIHFGQLIGALLLARPSVSRRLDWEDFDMLRTAGRQVASYIAEAQGQQALADARRFDEFNRRFAFIMHDIKNLVSQLSLLSRNARRHADNPDFRADMLLTLQECVDRMNDLLARLSQHNSAVPREPVAFALGDIAHTVRRMKERAHPVIVEGDMAVLACADPSRVEQIAMHLVQNAMEASAEGVPVVLRIERQGDMACMSVIDHGCGMAPDFVRNELFRPFASSKSGGFGIGAFEARELAQAMRGTLHVESAPGKGSRFTLRLPTIAAQSDTPEQGKQDRDGKEEAA